MKNLDALRERLPEAARDLKLNISSVLAESTLTMAQRWGVAFATALAVKHTALATALRDDALEAGIPEATLDDARAAAALMAMNNVFYRYRHLSGREDYNTMPARLRMQRLAKPSSTKLDLELFCLAVSAINACELCVQSHERVVLEAGLTTANIHDTVRTAAVVAAVAASLELV